MLSESVYKWHRCSVYTAHYLMCVPRQHQEARTSILFLSESEEAHRDPPGWSGLLHTEILQIGIRNLYSLNKIGTSFKGNIFQNCLFICGIVQKSLWFWQKFGSLKKDISHDCSEAPWAARRISRNILKVLSTNLKQNCH